MKPFQLRRDVVRKWNVLHPRHRYTNGGAIAVPRTQPLQALRPGQGTMWSELPCIAKIDAQVPGRLLLNGSLDQLSRGQELPPLCAMRGTPYGSNSAATWRLRAVVS